MQVLPIKAIHPRMFNVARHVQVLGVAALTIMGGLAVGAIASLIAKVRSKGRRYKTFLRWSTHQLHSLRLVAGLLLR